MATTVPSISIIGAGRIGSAVAKLALGAGAHVQVLTRDPAAAAALGPDVTPGTIGDELSGDIVLLAVPYPALTAVVDAYPQGMAGKVVIDPSNPIDFSTFTSLIEPVGSSAAQQLAESLPGAQVVKAFNTNFSGTLDSGSLADLPTLVYMAGSQDAKETLTTLVTAAGLRTADAGPLERARDLEALGALQIALVYTGQSQGGILVLP